MSRKGNRVIFIPEGVKVDVQGSVVKISGASGKEMMRVCSPGITFDIVDNKINVRCAPSVSKAIHGLENALIYNMIVGVHHGFTLKIVLKGTGYKAVLSDKVLEIRSMKSHVDLVQIPDGVDVSVERHNFVTIKGIDKMQVGLFADRLKKLRPVEPYKGKGIFLETDVIRTKEGKKSKK